MIKSEWFRNSMVISRSSSHNNNNNNKDYDNNAGDNNDSGSTIRPSPPNATISNVISKFITCCHPQIRDPNGKAAPGLIVTGLEDTAITKPTATTTSTPIECKDNRQRGFSTGKRQPWSSVRCQWKWFILNLMNCRFGAMGAWGGDCKLLWHSHYSCILHTFCTGKLLQWSTILCCSYSLLCSAENFQATVSRAVEYLARLYRSTSLLDDSC